MIKDEIRNYRKYCQYKADLIEMLDSVWYELTGVKGIRYDKQPTSFNSAISEERRLSLLDKVDQYESELTRMDMQIRYIDSVLDRLDKDENELVTYVLIEGHTLNEASEKLYLSPSAISKRITNIERKIENSNIER